MNHDKLELVPVLSTCDLVLLSLAKAALEENGIVYHVTGENAGYIYPPTLSGYAYNPIAGPPTIMVTREDADRAKEVLESITQSQEQGL
jgi:hypothetical protein